MKLQSIPVLDISELSKGYCLAIANSYRLVEDGEKLAEQKRFLAAVSAIAFAIDEILKAHLMSKAVLLDPKDSQKWKWFWGVYTDRYKKIEFLEKEIHPHVFKNQKDTDDYKIVLSVLRQDFVGVWFNEDTNKFMPPGDLLAQAEDQKGLSKKIYEYVLSLYKSLNIHGLPKPWTQEEVFRHMRETGKINSQS